MAAPSTSFLTKNINTISASGQHVINNRAIITDTEEILKDRFYLDDLLIAKDADGNDGFSGLCTIGSFNYSMHSTARIGSLRRYKTSEQVNFTDAGLNTKGRAINLTGDSALEIGGVKFDATYLPAYYIGVSVFFQYKKWSDSAWIDGGIVRYVPAKDSYFEDDRFWNLDSEYPNIKAGDIFDIRLKVSNSEGDTYTETASIVIKPYAIKMKFGTSPADAFNSNTLIDVYPSTRIIDLNTVLYEDVQMQQPYVGGYFIAPESNLWYRVDINGKVVEKGIYAPIAAMVYGASVGRLSSGAKLGDYRVELNIANANTSGNLLSDPCSFAVGKLINPASAPTLSNLYDVTNYSFPAVLVDAGTNNYRYSEDYSEEDYASYNFAWVFLQNGIETSNGGL